MAKLNLPKLPTVNASTFKGWVFVLVAGTVLAVLALIDGGDLRSGEGDGSTGCVVEVTTESLNVRSGPSQDAELLGTLTQGTKVDATRIVTDGFRQLEDNRWASDQFLTPVPGYTCS
jgi:uncharacterized protein YgiM (DUF1202 family)